MNKKTQELIEKIKEVHEKREKTIPSRKFLEKLKDIVEEEFKNPSDREEGDG